MRTPSEGHRPDGDSKDDVDQNLRVLSQRLGHRVHGIVWNRDGLPYFVEHDPDADLGVAT